MNKKEVLRTWPPFGCLPVAKRDEWWPQMNEYPHLTQDKQIAMLTEEEYEFARKCILEMLDIEEHRSAWSRFLFGKKNEDDCVIKG